MPSPGGERRVDAAAWRTLLGSAGAGLFAGVASTVGGKMDPESGALTGLAVAVGVLGGLAGLAVAVWLEGVLKAADPRVRLARVAGLTWLGAVAGTLWPLLVPNHLGIPQCILFGAVVGVGAFRPAMREWLITAPGSGLRAAVVAGSVAAGLVVGFALADLALPPRPGSGRQPRGHTGAGHGVAVTPDGRLLVAGGEDGIVRLWPLPLP